MRSSHEADRRFEFGVHGGVPEVPRPMYQIVTHGNTSPDRADSHGSARGREVLAAVFVLNGEGRVVVARPTDEVVDAGQ